MNTEELQRLVTQSAQGDAESFRMLVAHLDTKLFAYVHSRTSSREAAIDLVQDVLVDVWKALQKFTYTSDAGFYRFVYTIAKRHLYRVWRSPKTVSLEDIGETSEEPVETPVDDHLFVASAVERLEKTAREIVVLRHWSGFSFQEIGEMLGMKETAVRVRHHRALAHLRDSLQPYV